MGGAWLCQGTPDWKEMEEVGRHHVLGEVAKAQDMETRFWVTSWGEAEEGVSRRQEECQRRLSRVTPVPAALGSLLLPPPLSPHHMHSHIPPADHAGQVCMLGLSGEQFLQRICKARGEKR